MKIGSILTKAKRAHPSGAQKLSEDRLFSYSITPSGVYIINFAEIAYHPSDNEYISLSGEYIIIAKVIQPSVVTSRPAV